MRIDRPSLAVAVALLQSGDWKAAHAIVQEDEASALACWAHGIVHLLEGDTANARYWYKKAGRPFGEDVPKDIAALSAAVER
jgi:hypothetical protein